MNEVVRAYLIEAAKKHRPVAYGKVNQDCNLGLNLDNVSDRNKLSAILGEIAAYEYKNERPILSSVAMYKDLSDHGGGFLQICEDLGIGTKEQLKKDDFAIIEMNKCFEYWSKQKSSTFFQLSELEFFATYGYLLYDPNNPEHVNVKNQLLNTVWTKTANWARLVADTHTNYEVDGRRYWSQRGWGEFDGVKRPATRVKVYTWAKLFFKGQKHKDIFFTVGLSSQDFHFEIKIDYQRDRDSTLNENQAKICNEYLGTVGPKKVIIPYTELLDWDELLSITNDYIDTNEHHYIELLNLVWGGVEVSPYLPRTDVDYDGRNKRAKLLGDIGENIVLELEKKKIGQTAFKHKSPDIMKVKDLYGFDIFSFDEYGNPIRIEVKTTTRGIDEPFYMSRNEKMVCEDSDTNYFIYRIYNLDITKMPPAYDLKSFNVKDETMTFKAIQYEVSLF